MLHAIKLGNIFTVLYMIDTFSHILRNNFKRFYYSAKYNLVPLLNYEGRMYIFQKNNLISKENENKIIIIIWQYSPDSIHLLCHEHVLWFYHSSPQNQNMTIPTKGPSRLHNLVNGAGCAHSGHISLYYALRQ